MKKISSQKGFTLVELLISIFIIATISSIVLFQYRTYSDKTTLRGQTHEIALALREAQVNATNGKEFAPNTDKFRIQYGVIFDKTVTPPTFHVFGDRSGNGAFETTNDPNTTELLIQYFLRPGYSYDICVKATEITPTCTTLTKIVVLYNFGNFSAVIKDPATGTTYGYAEIQMYKSSNPTYKENIKIWSVGRIEN